MSPDTASTIQPLRSRRIGGPIAATEPRFWAPALIVVSATLFNAILAVVNAHVLPLANVAIIAAELVLVTAAHLVAFANYRAEMNRWYILMWIVMVIAVARGALTDSFDAKFLRDVLLIPTFIVLGMTFSAKALPKVVVTLIVVSASFMVLEALNTPTYEWIFEIRDFYVNTRGFTEAAFWNKDSSLFVSATRPDGRFFSIVDLHRLSSVFLEPVGSETFCIAAWTFICACPSLMTPRLRICLAIVVLLMIVGTDGRLAFITSGFILIVCVLAPKLPRRLPFFYLPILTACVGAVVYAAGLSFTSDDFSGRLALSMHLLAEFDAIDLLGASNRLVPWAADSGLAYLILTQSIVGTIVIWGFITLGGRQDTASQTRYVHATSAWLSLFMMVSATFLTIKTAALLWFIYGSLQGDREN